MKLRYYKLNEWVYCDIQLDRKRCGWRQQWITGWFCDGNCTHTAVDYWMILWR